MKSLVPAVLSLTFLISCAGTDARLNEAARNQGQILATRDLPEYPEQCRRIVRSGVNVGDRLDVALLRTDNALTLHQSLTRECAAWYDELKDRFSSGR